MITVWGRRNSFNVQKVMWTLGELDLEYQRHDMGGSFGITEEYAAMNPNRTVPTIQDGNVTLYESNACVRYLCRQYDMGRLWPGDPGEAAVADQWMEWQTNVFSAPFFPTFFNRVRLPPSESSPAAIQKGARQSGELLARLAAQLESRSFLIGDELTMADIPIAAMLYRYFNMDIERPSLPVIERYYARLTEREAYRYHVMVPFGSNPEEWLVHEKANAGIQ